jgi:hypothetical protein
MTLYAFALFLHVVGVLLLFAAITTEGIALFQLRRATTTSQVVTWQGVAKLARVFGPASVVAILVPGLYMMATSWGWVPWIAVGLLAWVAIAVMGAVNGIRLSVVVAAATSDPHRIHDLHARPFAVSWVTRLALSLGIVFLMTDKPGLLWAVLSVAVAAGIGVVAGLIATREMNSSADPSLTVG